MPYYRKLLSIIVITLSYHPLHSAENTQESSNISFLSTKKDTTKKLCYPQDKENTKSIPVKTFWQKYKIPIIGIIGVGASIVGSYIFLNYTETGEKIIIAKEILTNLSKNELQTLKSLRTITEPLQIIAYLNEIHALHSLRALFSSLPNELNKTAIEENPEGYNDMIDKNLNEFRGWILQDIKNRSIKK